MRIPWKALIGVVAVAIPALLNYLSARADSSEAKIRAEIAYVTLQESVKELQTASHEHALQIAELKGQLKTERRYHVGSEPTERLLPPPPLSRNPASVGAVLQDVSDEDGVDDKAPEKFEAPPDFEDAIRNYKAKK